MNWIGLPVIAIGTFWASAAIFDWDFFMGSIRARLFVSLFGRTGARLLFFLLGSTAIVFGVLISAGVVGARS